MNKILEIELGTIGQDYKNLNWQSYKERPNGDFFKTSTILVLDIYSKRKMYQKFKVHFNKDVDQLIQITVINKHSVLGSKTACEQRRFIGLKRESSWWCDLKALNIFRKYCTVIEMPTITISYCDK